MADEYLKKDDYEEPRCLLDMGQTPCDPIPVGRVIGKLDEYLSRNDYAAAERHLHYWLEEAQTGNDMKGRLSVLNELIGLYRKLDRREDGLRTIKDALKVLSALGLRSAVSGGTTLINAATAYKAFGDPEEALPLYEEARAVYETELSQGDGRLGGLYNNMALALTDLRRYAEAEDLYNRALSVMERQEYGEAERAITYLNMADLIADRDGMEEGEALISNCLQQAETLLDTESLPRNGYYAFVCEKCAPVFGYYGWFLTEQTLKERAEAIYAKNRNE
ncbi:MAG: tetratricopeptide repeat protein [Lachnospiraceae bacterium]|nr:tetratricopeptide repeat protein [Lachnospiraceae bacterium]